MQCTQLVPVLLLIKASKKNLSAKDTIWSPVFIGILYQTFCGAFVCGDYLTKLQNEWFWQIYVTSISQKLWKITKTTRWLCLILLMTFVRSLCSVSTGFEVHVVFWQSRRNFPRKSSTRICLVSQATPFNSREGLVTLQPSCQLTHFALITSSTQYGTAL